MIIYKKGYKYQLVQDYSFELHPKFPGTTYAGPFISVSGRKATLSKGYAWDGASGPARGIFQMEPATHDDIWRYLDRPKNRILREIVESMGASEDELVYNLRYATAMARIKFWYVPESLPETIEGQAEYYKTYYNTAGGAGSVEKYLAMHKKYLGE